ncbi:putative Phosphomannomutase [Monocercomonoides exilis]|uniref:putative Phosphomannomutase n=1 Tax=Monocercomonoides exilis TaxID=2049356 RepID=UPI00355AA8A1|nr:putative Phosphomannomutase [Monocercomonoides exilis]|eukprot:MONOS_14412.1-p1 / transcript=MONOS_14412.1 / gene=MONOS_14412 / organism=Monocercomonoides_exilis_PA203 / gene_product=Phosphomannomutase / transcript_product=Phosphomannomutase / location=Mono_scaffold00997:4490-6828(+) / protein_length=482 / sequence_SO=supercontig / SO=protein_coding / is_pseudo=false
MTTAPLMVTVSGVRGIAHKSLTVELVETFVGTFAAYLQRRDPSKKLRIVLGRDSRISGPEFEKVVVDLLTSLHCDVYNLGICPTPTVQFMVIKLGFEGGLIITSSHNPTEWNGLKFVDSDGLFLSPPRCEEMYALSRTHTKETPVFTRDTDASKFGKVTPYPQAMHDHISAVLSLKYISVEMIRSAKIRVCIDTINGGGSVYVPELLREMGVEIVGSLNTEPTGRFAHEPEPIPQNLKSLCELVAKTECDLGIAVDPDADRLVLVNEKGEPLGEEYTLALCTEMMLSIGGKKGIVCKNRSTTRAIDDIAHKYGCECEASPVGEANVAALMLKTQAVFGGEGNGGVMLPDVHIGRDSLVGLGLVMQLLAHFKLSKAAEDQKAHTAISDLKATLPQYEIVKDKIPLSASVTAEHVDEILAKIKTEWDSKAKTSTIDGLFIETPSWWVHLRKSNTEKIVRVIGEAHTHEEAKMQCEMFHHYFDE